MDDDKNKVMIIIGLVLLGIMFIGMIFFRPAKPRPGVEIAPRRVATQKADPEKKHQQTPTQPQMTARSFGPRVVRGAEEAEKAREVHKEKIREEAAKWLEKLIADTSISTHTRELYAARNNPLIQSANYYLHKGEDLKAAEEFEKAALDPESRLSVRFIAVRQLFFLARIQKNSDNYFKWGKMLGEMVKDNDLSFFDQPQSSEFIDRIKYQEIYYKARSDKAMQEAIANYLINEKKGYDKELAMEEVLRRIRDVEEELQG